MVELKCVDSQGLWMLKCDCGKDHFTELVRVFVGGEVVPAPTRCRNEGFAKV